MGQQVAKRPKAVEVDVGAPIRRWWKAQHLGDTPDHATLAQAMSDVGVMSLALLARQLENPKTSDKVKVQIALIMAPRLVAEVRGRVAGAGRKMEAEVQTTAVSGLLGAYGVQ